MLGLPTILAGDFKVGKEGPFIHLASIIAHNIMQVPYFKEI